MSRKRSSGEKKEKRTPVKLAPIPRKHAGKITEPWAVMESLIVEMAKGNPTRFGHLEECKIRMWWMKDPKADLDGVAIGAAVGKASELDRLLVEDSSGESPDIFIKLPRDQWPRLDDTEKEHRLFHELCHIRPAMDANGNQKRDSKERLLWRLGRHPIVAFQEEVDRFGVDRILGHNGAILKAAETASRPLMAKFDAAEDAADESAAAGSSPASKSTNTDADGWKRLAITELQLPPAVESFVISSGYRRIGKFSEYMAEKAEFWDKDLKVGDQRKPPKFREKIEEAFLTFWRDHPEYTQS